MNAELLPEPSGFSLGLQPLPFLSSTNMSQIEEQTDNSTLSASAPLATLSNYARGYPKFHHHTISDGSNDSSPTTTISTVDDSSATEPSPGSSPESPPPTTFAVGMLRPRTADELGTAFFELQKQPPPRKGRNLKGLAVDTARQPGQKAAPTPSLALPLPKEDGLAGLSSPGFVPPPPPPKTKRRPSNLGLTLLTPGGLNKTPPKEIRVAIPPTPSFNRPTLRHFQSSPSLPAFPGLGLRGSLRTHAPLPTTLGTILSPIELPKQDGVSEEEDEQNFDIPLSREEKPEAYPNGPITIYDPSVDLYLEPTAEQCRQYDVIMNVANEVRNPFILYEDPDPTAQGIRMDGGGGIQLAPKRSQLTTVMDGEDVVPSGGSPTTPKAIPLNSHFPREVSAKAVNDPEYMHIRWDHNSDIVPDLLRLVKVIDDNVTQGKRVLIHCQCGVSRSASLLVAYGLYKDPSMSVQEAYDAVKKRSKWIGPNMNLIMQLQEFRTSLARGGVLSSDRGLSPITPSSAFREWHGSSAQPSNSPLSAAEDATSKSESAPLSAVSPGPSSAPSGQAWPTISQQSSPVSSPPPTVTSAMKANTAYVDASGHVVPALNVVAPEFVAPPRPRALRAMPMAYRRDERDAVTPVEPLSSPRSEHFSMTSLRPSRALDSADSFGMMSPTSTEFSSPFDRSALLASLGMGFLHETAPRRSLSAKSRTKDQESTINTGLQPLSARRLRGKISSPTLREQQQLQSLQAKIEASLSHRPKTSTGPSASFMLRPIDEALTSPRATEFTKNPFALSLTVPPLTTPPMGGLASTDEDPRSPAHSGVSPITRNIMDVL